MKIPRLFAYLELIGQVDEATLLVRLAQIVSTGYDEESEISVREWPEFGIRVEGEFVEPIAIALRDIPVPEPGMYEFQLWLVGESEPMARERILAAE